jgi:hypothetical protein
VTEADLIEKKGVLRAEAKKIVDHLRELVAAPR